MKKILSITLSFIMIVSMIISMPFAGAINKKNISNMVEWTQENEFTYDGEIHSRFVSLKDDELLLVEGQDYEIAYYIYNGEEFEGIEITPYEIGDYSVVVKGIGDYTGEAENEFSIVADTSGWGVKAEYSGILNYVDTEGTTSAEVSKNSIVWLKEESAGSSAWYGFDNQSSEQFRQGSRFWTRWLNESDDSQDYQAYYNKLDDNYKNSIKDGKLWIFLTGVTDPDGNDYTDLSDPLSYYVQIGEDWDKNDLCAVFIGDNKDEEINISFDENWKSPENNGNFAKMELEHFSAYAVFQKSEQTSSVSIRKNEGAFAKDAPIATLRIDNSKINTENVQLTQFINQSVSIRFELDEAGHIYANDCPVKPGYYLYGSFSLRFEDAVILPDNSRTALEVMFNNVTVIGKQNNSTYTDKLFFAYITGSVDDPISFCPQSVEQLKHVGMRADVRIRVPDAAQGDTFMFASRSINVSREGNFNFSGIIDSAINYNYSESVEPVSGIAAGSDIYLTQDSMFMQKQGSSPTGYGYRFVATGGPKDTYQNGFATVVDAQDGFYFRVWSSAGNSIIPIEIYLLSSDTSFVLETTACEGGSISLWADGTADSQSSALLPGGSNGNSKSYSVPDGKTVTVVIKPDDGYVLDKLTLNSVEVQPTRTNYEADGETIASYEYDIPVSVDRSVCASFKHAHSFSYTVDSENFCIIANCTEANCPLTDSRIIVQGAVPEHKVYADYLSINATVSGKDELVAATEGAATVSLSYRTADGAQDFGENAPNGYETYSAVITINDSNNSYTVSRDYSFSKKYLSPAIICQDWTYGEEPYIPHLALFSNPEYALTVYSYKEKGAPDSEYTTDIPVNAGVYTLRAVRPESRNYLEGISYSEISVHQAECVYTVPTGLQATYGDRLSSVQLPEGWEWNDASQYVGNVGDNSFEATFTPADSRNYKSVSENITLSVVKKAVTITAQNKSSFKGADLLELTYLIDSELPAGDNLGIVLSTAAQKDALGVYEITVSYTDNANYDVTIVNAEYTVLEIPVYSVILGEGAVWVQGNDEALEFILERNYNDDETFANFRSIEVDNKAVDTAFYDAVSGSVNISLKTSFLDTLAVGEHTMKVLFADGEAETTFTVLKAEEEPTTEPAQKSENISSFDSEKTPSTGDEVKTALLVSALCASIGAIALIKRRKDYV